MYKYQNLKHRCIASLLVLCISMLSTLTAQDAYTVDEAVAYALEHSREIAISDLEIKSADYTIKETRAIGIPKVNGNVDYTYYFYQPKTPVKDFITPAIYGVLNQEGLIQKAPPEPRSSELSFVQPNQLDLGLSANTLLFDGTYIVGLQASKVYKDLALRQKESTEEKIRNNVVKAYTSILITEINRTFLENNIATLQGSLKEMQAMYENGFVEQLDVDRLQLSLNQTETSLTNLEQLTDLSYNLLKFQMGYPLDKDITISQSLDELLLAYDVNSTLEDITINPEQRADFRALQGVQSLNELDLKRYRWGYLPQLVAFASYRQSLQRENLFDNDETGFLPTGVVGAKLNIPIYDGGDKSAKIQKAKIKIEKNMLQQESFKEGMKLQVSNAIVSIKNAQADVKSKKAALDLAQKIFDKTKVKFTEGVGSSVEVTQAEAALFGAQTQYSDALYKLLEARLDLDIALGNI